MQQPRSPSIVLEGHREAVTVLAFSSNGRMLATGSRDKNVQLWNVEDILRAPNRDRVPRCRSVYPSRDFRALARRATG